MAADDNDDDDDNDGTVHQNLGFKTTWLSD